MQFVVKTAEVHEFAAEYGVVGARWVLEFGLFSVSLCYQVKFKEINEWSYGSSYYSIWANLHWDLGRKHGYYDGPHDSFSLGFLHFAWSGAWCQKCYDGE